MAEVNQVKISQGGRMAEDKRGKSKLILIAVAILLLLGGIGFVSLIFLGGGEDGAMMGAAAPASAGRVIGVGKACPTDQLMYLNLGEFVVNLADGRRYLKTNIDLMLCDENVDSIYEYLEIRMAEVKDRMVSRLQTLSTEQLRSPREREELRQDLLNEVYRLLPNDDLDWEDPEPVKKVLLTEFYLQ